MLIFCEALVVGQPVLAESHFVPSMVACVGRGPLEFQDGRRQQLRSCGLCYVYILDLDAVKR